MLSGELDEVMVVVLDNIRGMQSCCFVVEGRSERRA